MNSPQLRLLLYAAILMVGFASSYGVFRYATEASRDLSIGQFKMDSARQLWDINLSLTSTLNGVEDLANFIRNANPSMSAQQFANLAEPILARERSLQGLSWNAVVDGSQRRAFEVKAQVEYPAFAIYERDLSGSPVRAPDRDQYVVVRAVHPLLGNEAALGFNVASEARRRDALIAAREKKALQATAPITLVQGTAHKPGVLVFAPSRTGADAEAFVVAVLRPDDAISAAIAGVDEGSIGLTVWDVEPASSARTSLPEAQTLVDRALTVRAASIPTHEIFMELAGRWWRFEFAAGPSYAPDTTTPLLLAGSGMTATLLALLWLGVTTRHNRTLATQIEQRVQAEAALSESAERLRLVIDSIAGHSWDWDLNADRLLFPGVGSTWVDDSWAAIVHPDERADVLDALHSYAGDSEVIFEREFRLKTTNGDYRTFLNRGKIVAWNEDGTAARMVGLSEDVTERRKDDALRERLEEKVRESQKLDSLGMLAGGIAHDFNNLLVGMLSAADLARVKAKDPDIVKLLQMVIDAAQSAASLTKEILTYAGRGEVDLVALDARTILIDMKPLLTSSIDRRLQLEIDLGQVPLPVLADATQMRQICMNLVINAADASVGTAGPIVVRLDSCEIRHEDLRDANLNAIKAGGRFVRLTVEDAGAGMDKETLERALEPFYSTKALGRGLGLASVAGIVRRHCGALLIETVAERGTRVVVLLPAAEAAAVTATRLADSPAISRAQQSSL